MFLKKWLIRRNLFITCNRSCCRPLGQRSLRVITLEHEHHFWSPVSVISGCLAGEEETGEEAAGAAVRPLHVFLIPTSRLSLSSSGLLLPSRLFTFVLLFLLPACLSICLSPKLPIRLSICLSAGEPVCGVALGSELFSTPANYTTGHRCWHSPLRGRLGVSGARAVYLFVQSASRQLTNTVFFVCTYKAKKHFSLVLFIMANVFFLKCPTKSQTNHISCSQPDSNRGQPLIWRSDHKTVSGKSQ